VEPVTSRLARGAVGNIVDTHRDHRERLLYPYSVDSPVAAADPHPLVDMYRRRLADVRTSFSPLREISIGTPGGMVSSPVTMAADARNWIRRDCLRVTARNIRNRWRTV